MAAWRRPDLDAPLVDYAATGTKVELEGTDAVEGKSAYKLRLTKKSGEQVNLWVDASSFLELKMDGEPRRMDGRMRKVAIYFRDYKQVNGLALPYEAFGHRGSISREGRTRWRSKRSP